ncbi:MAG: T9SS type A sorting domain-containing protein, partial [Bacteroidota bacterium]
RLTVYNSSGIEILSSNYNVTAGEKFETKLPVRTINNGNYFYRIESGDQSYSGKFTVLKR